MTIDSVDNKKIKNIRKLNQKKYRDETNEFLVEGIHLVKEAYKEGLLKEVVLEENEEIDFKVDTTYVTYNVIKSISSLDTPYKIIGVCKKKEEKEINGKNIKNVKVNGKYAIIMGNEGNGVRENIKNLSDEKLYIKMSNDCESLNVGVATSIILYEFS